MGAPQALPGMETGLGPGKRQQGNQHCAAVNSVVQSNQKNNGPVLPLAGLIQQSRFIDGELVAASSPLLFFQAPRSTRLVQASYCFGTTLVCGAAGLPAAGGAFTLRDDCILRGPEPVTGVWPVAGNGRGAGGGAKY